MSQKEVNQAKLAVIEAQVAKQLQATAALETKAAKSKARLVKMQAKLVEFKKEVELTNNTVQS